MALAALISALTMLAAQPAILLAQADAAPAQAPVRTTTATSQDQANADALANGEDPFPAGAPTDDYGFMSWCYGALAGHMDLYDRVLPEVKRIEAEFPDNGDPIDKVMASYAAQHEEGKQILDSYAKALDLVEAAKKTGSENRAAGVAAGRQVWLGFDSKDADDRQLAQLWMSWGLPGRCEATADRLLHRTAGK